MGKLFEMIGALMATACLVQLAADPAAALRDIRRGPVPNLTALNRELNCPKYKEVRSSAARKGSLSNPKERH